MIKIPPDEANVRELRAKAEALAEKYGFDLEAGPSIEQGERIPLFDYLAALQYTVARDMLEQARREAPLPQRPKSGRDGNVLHLPLDTLLEKKRRDVQRDLAAAIEELHARQVTNAVAAECWRTMPAEEALRIATDVVGYEAQLGMQRQSGMTGDEPEDESDKPKGD